VERAAFDFISAELPNFPRVSVYVARKGSPERVDDILLVRVFDCHRWNQADYKILFLLLFSTLYSLFDYRRS